MKTVYQELRGCYRIKDNFKVKWQNQKNSTNGNGKVLNISASGMLFEADSNFSPVEKCLLAFEALANPQKNYIPKEGRLVWSKRNPFSSRFLCGIEFVDPASEKVAQIKQKVQAAVRSLSAQNKVKNIVGGSLMIVAAGLSAYVVIQFSENYKNIEASQRSLAAAIESQQALSQQYSKELVSARALLSETEAILFQSELDNASLKAAAAEKNAEFQKKISTLTSTNAALTAELAAVREDLRVLEGKALTLDEGKVMITMFKKKLRGLKYRMKELQQEAHHANIAAQKERDRAGMLAGNNGFYVRDGKAQPPTPANSPSGKLKVNVELYK